MTRATISVIVPIYRVEPYIKRCVDSILDSTVKMLEVILIDDGSPDACGAICDAYAKHDPRVKVIHQENKGLSEARNAGLDVATGTYIGFVDSDDYLEPDMFEKLLQGSLRFDAEIAVCGYYTDTDGKLAGFSFDEDAVLSNEDALRMLIDNKRMHNFVWNKLYRHDLFDGIRFPPGRNFEDIPVMYRLFERAGRIALIKNYLYYYVQRNDSIIGRRNLGDELNACENYIERFNDLSQRYPSLAEQMLVRLFDPCVKHLALIATFRQKELRAAFSGRIEAVRGFFRLHEELSDRLSRYDAWLLNLARKGGPARDRLFMLLCLAEVIFRKAASKFLGQ